MWCNINWPDDNSDSDFDFDWSPPKIGTPVISIGEGQDANSYDFSKPITFMSLTEGVTFHYTTNGLTIPTEESTNGETITLPTNENSTYTVKVIGVKAGYANSDVTEKTFTKEGIVAAPVISIGEGQDANSYDFSKPITFMSSTEGVTFYYTTNDIKPTEESASGESITLPTDKSTYTVKVIAMKAGYENSKITEKIFTKME